ncbi:MAG TPA: hypothetical protein VJZ49_13820 [Syntrophales bacterium]|nr:hypothetical protein [Syntrophales bacterium]
MIFFDVVSAERERATVAREVGENFEGLQIYTGSIYAPDMEVEALNPGIGKDIKVNLEIFKAPLNTRRA